MHDKLFALRFLLYFFQAALLLPSISADSRTVVSFYIYCYIVIYVYPFLLFSRAWQCLGTFFRNFRIAASHDTSRSRCCLSSRSCCIGSSILLILVATASLEHLARNSSPRTEKPVAVNRLATLCSCNMLLGSCVLRLIFGC